MKYGFFDESKKEYVITRPDTPGTLGELSWISRIWSNYF